MAQVERRVLSSPFSTAWTLLIAAQLAPVYVALWYHLVARVASKYDIKQCKF